MNKIAHYFDYAVHRYGVFNLFGTLLISLSLVLFFFFTVSVHRQLIEAQESTLHLRQHLHSRQLYSISKDPQTIVSEFYRVIPPELDITNELERFFDAAFENNLYIDSVEYRLEEDSFSEVHCYRITIPITGTYAEIRKFIKQLLFQMPNAALESISLSRENSIEQEITARLQISLFMKAKTKHAS